MKKCKADYVIALDLYYHLAQSPFIDFLKKDYKGKQNVNKMIEKYDLIGLKGDDYSIEDLYNMGNFLTRWNTSKGYLKLVSDKISFDDQIDQLRWEDDNL